MKLFLICIVLVALVVLLLGVNIFFRNKPFPDGEISHNRELRRRGIICANEQERKLWGKKRRNSRQEGCEPDSCGDCSVSCHKQ
ncbi:MAG: hypothetical protein HUJ89_02605 [Bacteroidales bacterium]|nr:hypothetical protein [Bacteroidales bacterium]